MLLGKSSDLPFLLLSSPLRLVLADSTEGQPYLGAQEGREMVREKSVRRPKMRYLRCIAGVFLCSKRAFRGCFEACSTLYKLLRRPSSCLKKGAERQKNSFGGLFLGFLGGYLFV